MATRKNRTTTAVQAPEAKPVKRRGRPPKKRVEGVPEPLVPPGRTLPDVTGPEFRLGEKYLSQPDLSLLELTRLRNEHALARKEFLELQIKQVTSDERALLLKLPGMDTALADAVMRIHEECAARVSALKTDQSTNAKDVVQTHNALLDALKALEAAYQEDFTQISYDTVTGKIHNVARATRNEE